MNEPGGSDELDLEESNSQVPVKLNRVSGYVLLANQRVSTVTSELI
jgi:hypothetical protein